MSPKLSILYPSQGTLVSTREVTIQGVADPQSDVHINGGRIILDESGHFSEKALLKEGLNEFIIEVQNFWGMKKVKTLKLIYNP